MNHGKKKKKFNRTAEHRKAMFRNMATSLLFHEQIETTLHKAKALKPIAEKIITRGKKGSLHHRRRVARDIQNPAVVRKIFEELAPRYENRSGGYTRVIRNGFRRGDNAEMAIIELVDRDISAKGKKVPRLPTKAERSRPKKTGRGRGPIGGDS